MEVYTVYRENDTTEDRIKKLDTTSKKKVINFLKQQSLDDLWLFVIVIQDSCDSDDPDNWEYDTTIRTDEWIKYYA